MRYNLPKLNPPSLITEVPLTGAVANQRSRPFMVVRSVAATARPWLEAASQSGIT